MVSFTAIIIIQLQRRKQANQFLSFLRISLNPFTKCSFRDTLLFQDFQMLDSFISSDTVLPVIGAFIVLRSVFNTNIGTTVHLPFPDSLLYPTYINHCPVNSVHHFFDTIRREITLRTARITQSHTKRAFLVSVQRNRNHVFRAIRDIFR